tara:strand:- start:206 stop:439 length:234 start_codon:yes stop_codon:yes gene_type:complete
MSRQILHFDCDNIPQTETGATMACMFDSRDAAIKYAESGRQYIDKTERIKTSKRTVRVEGATLTVWVVTWRKWPYCR